ncbi:MAG TPA: hypothetical protein VFX89_15750, partial [Gammaproteobacteria bacterium]|nr:hypothetical protein [Gammaproteobacteria bacterium]
MNELKAVLSAFLAGQAEFAQVDAVLAQSLQADPSIAPGAFAAIDQIYKSGRLPLQLYVLLKNRIAQSHAAARAQTQASAPAAPTPPPAAPAQDRTIFNPAAAAGAQPQGARPGAAQAQPPAQAQVPMPPPAQPQEPPRAQAEPPRT